MLSVSRTNPMARLFAPPPAGEPAPPISDPHAHRDEQRLAKAASAGFEALLFRDGPRQRHEHGRRGQRGDPHADQRARDQKAEYDVAGLLPVSRRISMETRRRGRFL
jgi:hypothetical protein